MKLANIFELKITIRGVFLQDVFTKAKKNYPTQMSLSMETLILELPILRLA